MLSKNERLYLQGKKKLNSNYRRRLHHSIKRKVISAFEDFPLLLNLPEKTQIALCSDDKLVDDALRVLMTMNYKYHDYTEKLDPKKIGELMTCLHKAGIPYDYEKLCKNSDYRAVMGRKLRLKKH